MATLKVTFGTSISTRIRPQADETTDDIIQRACIKIFGKKASFRASYDKSSYGTAASYGQVVVSTKQSNVVSTLTPQLHVYIRKF